VADRATQSGVLAELAVCVSLVYRPGVTVWILKKVVAKKDDHFKNGSTDIAVKKQA
jgi:hypothetical protein